MLGLETNVKKEKNQNVQKIQSDPFNATLHKYNQKQDIKNREFSQTIKIIFNQIQKLELYPKVK